MISNRGSCPHPSVRGKGREDKLSESGSYSGAELGACHVSSDAVEEMP